MSVFRDYAKYYDIIYADKEYEKECDFLEDIFSRFSKSRPKSILDIGCGTGGHAIPLGTRGYRVTGIDASDEMISRAKDKATKLGVNVNFQVSDIKEIWLEQKFDACIGMFSVMDYLVSYADIKNALDNIRVHLNQGSVFIFDFWNGIAVLTTKPSVKVKIVEREGKRIIRMANPTLDAIRHLCEIEYHIIVTEKDTITDELVERHVIRFFFPQEISYYLEENGFALLKMCPFLDVDREMDERTWHVTAITMVK